MVYIITAGAWMFVHMGLGRQPVWTLTRRIAKHYATESEAQADARAICAACEDDEACLVHEIT